MRSRSITAYHSCMADLIFCSFLHSFAVLAVCVAFLLARQVKKPFKFSREKPQQGAHTMHGFLYNLGEALFPLITISMLKLTTVLGAQFQFDAWLLEIAVVVALMLFVNSLITGFVVERHTWQVWGLSNPDRSPSNDFTD